MTTIDALSQLPRFSWRGQEYPVIAASYSFRHEDAEHKLSFGNLALIEPMGPRNPTFRYTLAMRAGLGAQWVELIPRLRDDCHDKTPGPLADPLYGEWTCKCTDFASSLDPRSNRDGANVDVSFLWAPSIDEDVPKESGVASIQNLRDEAAALDAEAKRVSRRYQEPAPEATADILSAAGGVLGQLDRGFGKLEATLDDFVGKVQKVENQATRLSNRFKGGDAIGLKRNARRLRGSAVRTGKQMADIGANVVQFTVNEVTNVLTVAAQAGMTFKELASLNPTIVQSPEVAPGTIVNVYQ